MEQLTPEHSARQLLYKPDLHVYGEMPYDRALAMVRERVAGALQKSIEELSETDLKGMILRDIENHQVKCALTDDAKVLTQHIYHDMARLSFISREGLFQREGFEEININGWDDVEIVVTGEKKKTDYSFLSPQQAEDIMLRIFRRTRTKFDEVAPHATADVGSGIRITALKAPLVDASRGVCASIRKVDTQTIGRMAILAGDTLTAPMLELLELCLRYGVSMCISGETGAGKTTLAGSLLSDAADTLRIYTIEEGAREWDFIKRDESGRIINSVVHTRTRLDGESSLMNIDQEHLCKLALRYDPDIVAPSEIRGREAFEVMSIANTGHTICTTIHSNGTADTPSRVVELAKKAFSMDDSTLFTMCARAFPILVHMKKGADHRRRVTEIREVLGYENGAVQSRLLYDFLFEDNIQRADGSKQVVGHFRHLAPISTALTQKLLEKGAVKRDLLPYLKGGEEHAC